MYFDVFQGELIINIWSYLSLMSKLIIYQGSQYNILPFLATHPGGPAIIDHYLTHKTDITQVFKSTHSKRAEEKLLCLEEVSHVDRTKFQRIYCRIEQRVKRFYSPNYFIEVTLTLFITSLFISSLILTEPVIVIATTSICQIVTAWSVHSQLHIRNRFLINIGKIYGGVVLGLSYAWWKAKHYQHHFFTNHEMLDTDITHNYSVYLYPFMLLKWRMESLFSAIRFIKFEQMIYLAIHYVLVFFRLKILPALVGLAIASMYLAVVTQGNHVRESRYKSGKMNDFLIQQLESTRNYDWEGFLSTFLLGGFNFHVQHHLFPKIPFYKLEEAHRIVAEELELSKLNVSSGDILI